MMTLNIELEVTHMKTNFLRKGSNITCIGVSRKKLDCGKNDGPKGYFVKWKFKKDSQVPPELKLFISHDDYCDCDGGGSYIPSVDKAINHLIKEGLYIYVLWSNYYGWELVEL